MVGSPRFIVALLAGLICSNLTAAPALADTPSWPSYHLNNRRDANNSGEGVVQVSQTPRWAAPLDGLVYAEPLVQGNEVFVATENDSVYSLDLHTGAVNWVQQVRTPAGSTPLFPVAQSAFGNCGDIFPLGVTSTPVLDPATHQLFLVADAWDGIDINSIHHYFWALDTAAAGNPVVPGVAVDPPAADGFTPHDQQQRAALALSGGHVYVTYGGLSGDCFTYNGWIARVGENGSGARYLNVTAAAGIGGRGGIWGSSGPAIDDSGNVFVATGNGNQFDNSQPSDLTDSVVKLSADLTVLDHFTPTTWGDENRNDLDLGSSGPLLLSGGLLYQAGKTGGYLLNTASLGGGNDKGGAAFFSGRCHGFGGNAYDSVTDIIYAACTDGVRALQVHRPNTGGCTTATTPCFTELWHGPGDASAPPIIGGGEVWLRGALFGTSGMTPTSIYGLNPATGRPDIILDGIDGAVHFATPTFAGATLLLGTGSSVTAWSYAPPPPPANWTPWQSIGGYHSGQPVLGRQPDGRVVSVVLGSDRALWVNTESSPNSNRFTGWQSVGGVSFSDPALGVDPDGRIELFAVGTDTGVWRIRQAWPGGPFANWEALGGFRSGKPVVGTNANGRLELFVRGDDGAIWHDIQGAAGGNFQGWYSLGGFSATDPSAGRNADGRLGVFVVGSDTAVWSRDQTPPGGPYGGWQSLGGNRSGAPAVGLNVDGRLELFVRGADQSIWHDVQGVRGGGFSGWYSLGGFSSTDPAVGRNADGRLDAFVVGSDSGVWALVGSSPGAYSAWSPIRGDHSGPPVPGNEADGRITVFVIGRNTATWVSTQTAPNQN